VEAEAEAELHLGDAGRCEREPEGRDGGLTMVYREATKGGRQAGMEAETAASPVRYALRSIHVVHISRSHGSTHVLSPFEKRVALDLKIPCRSNFIKFEYFINRYKNICIVLHRLYYSILPPYQIINLF